MTAPRILDDLQAKRLDAQRRLASSYVPEDSRPTRRAHPLSTDRIEAAAKAIYGVVTCTDDPDKLNEKWARVARPITKDRHRREAEAALRTAF